MLSGIKQMLPALLGHRSGKVFGAAMKLRFRVLFWGARSGVQTPSEAGYPRTFYEGFTDPVWASFWGAPLGALPRTKDRIFHGALVAGLHWSAIVCISQHSSALGSVHLHGFALSCVGLCRCLHVALAAHHFGFCRRQSTYCQASSKCFPPFWGIGPAKFLERL